MINPESRMKDFHCSSMPESPVIIIPKSNSLASVILVEGPCDWYAFELKEDCASMPPKSEDDPCSSPELLDDGKGLQYS